MAEQVSLLFADERHRVGELLIDAVIKETHEFKTQVSEHPTESGESFCDHLQNLPVQIQIEGVISNTPMTLVGLTVITSLTNYFTDRSNDLALLAFEKIEEIFKKREPITIATTLKEYPNMVLESLSVERGENTSESLHFKATAKQVCRINQSLIEFPEPKVERAKPKRKMGKQESKTAAKQTLASATEIETFLTCQRKWGFIFLDEIEPGISAALKLGTAVHRVLEKYLIDNEINYETLEGQIAKSGLSFLPKRISPNNVEKKVFFEVNGLTFSGTPDFFVDLGDKVWLLGDHKTCSAFSSALTKEMLKTNIQANVYARWLFEEKGAREVKLNWIYYRTKGAPQAKCIEAKLTPEDNAKNWEYIVASAKTITQLAQKKPDTKNLPKNLSACFKYGPCPFYAHCKNDQRIPLAVKKEESLPALPYRNTGSFHLYIDCVPTKSENAYQRTIELSELLKPVLSQIQIDKQLSHYRLAGYGQHVGLIANYLENHLNEQHYDSGTAVLSSLKTPEGCDTVQTLSKAAGQIVRGF